MNTKKKILYIITQGTWGGAQRYVFDLATNLGPEFNVVVAIGEPGGKADLQKKLANNFLDASDQNTPTIIQLKHLHRAIHPFQDFLAVFELAKLYFHFRPDIVHLNSTKAGIIGSLARCGLLFKKAAIIYTAHGWIFNEPLAPHILFLYTWLERLTLHLKNRVIVLSKPDQDSGEKVLQATPDHFALIPLGIKPPAQSYSQEKAREILSSYLVISTHDTKQWVGTIANLYPTKGVDILIESIALCKEKLPPVIFTIIGEGPEQARLSNLVKLYGLEKIVYLSGGLENAAYLIPGFDLMIVPSRKEGLPYTIIEAMMAGKPIIATAVGGITTLIEHKKTGLLVEKPEASLLATALLFALLHPEEMTAYGKAAQLKSASYSLDSMLRQTTAIYHSLTA